MQIISRTISHTQFTLQNTNTGTDFKLPGQYRISCGCQSADQGFKPVTAPWTVTQPKSGAASIELGDRYELALDENKNHVTLCNRDNGEQTCLWGNGNAESNAQEAITYQLEDGTKITLRSQPQNAGIGVSLKDITITQSSRTIQVTGLDNGQTGDLTINQSNTGGELMDWAVTDGHVIQRQANGKGWNNPEQKRGSDMPAPPLTRQMGHLLGVYLLIGLIIKAQPETETGKPAKTTVAHTSGDDNLKISQRKDGGLNITTKGETVRLDQSQSQNLNIKTDNQIIIDDNVTANVEIKSRKDNRSQLGSVSGDEGSGSRATSDPELDTTALSKAELAQTVRTEPNQGVQTNEIEALIYQTNVDYSIGNYKLKETNLLLLKDGWGYTDLSIPPGDFNIETSRKLEADKWEKWQFNSASNQYEIFNSASDQWVQLDGSNVMADPLSIPDNQKLSGYYKRIHVFGSPFFGNVTTTTDSIELTENGQFKLSEFNLSTSSFNNPLDTSVTLSHAENSAGTTRTTSLSNSSMMGSADSGAFFNLTQIEFDEETLKRLDKTGTFQITGNTIELHHDSGRISRQLFFQNGENIFVGNQIYWAT